MIIEATSLVDVIKITPLRQKDSRGYFCELFREDLFRKHVTDVRFVQDNQSLSWRSGTLRGLHYQRAPYEQGKLVRVVSGAIFDVAVDLRDGSPTFGHWTGSELWAENGTQLWIPEGFAHGFVTLRPHTVVHYKVTAPYQSSHEAGLLWDDPDLAIDWPLSAAKVNVSSQDAQQPRLRDIFNRPDLSQEAGT